MLNVHDLGDPAGAPLLAVHGIRAHGRRFRRLAEEGWPERRTLAVDLRGHGRSTYDGPWSIDQLAFDLVDTLDACGIDAVDVVGHSYGGVVALHLLGACPERVRRLVMLDPAFLLPGEQGSAQALATIADPGWATVGEATIARNEGLGDEINPAVHEDIAEHLVQGADGRYRFRFHPPAVVTGWGELCRPLPAVPELRPTLLVAAARAEWVTADVVADLRALLGEHLTTASIDCGHMLYWERFDETAAAVRTFLDATLVSRG